MWNPVFPEPFQQDVKSLMKKDKILYERLWKKIAEIMQNPEHYPMKRYELKGTHAAHVGSFVVAFRIAGEDVIFLKFGHHDNAYD